MLSEPGGRYTPHQAGDLNIFAEIFEQLNEGLFKPPESNHLSTSFNFAVKHEAPFLCCASPPDCTYEILSYNSITRSRRILWCEVAPYVRAIARIEALHYQLNVQSVDERVSKRRTRTTLAAARGDTVMRKEAKILENNIQSILDTWISPWYFVTFSTFGSWNIPAWTGGDLNDKVENSNLVQFESVRWSLRKVSTNDVHEGHDCCMLLYHSQDSINWQKRELVRDARWVGQRWDNIWEFRSTFAEE